jgi:hypothetical protein
MILLTVSLQASERGLALTKCGYQTARKSKHSRKSPPTRITTTHASPLQQLVAPLSLARQRRKLLTRYYQMKLREMGGLTHEVSFSLDFDILIQITPPNSDTGKLMNHYLECCSR